MSEFSPEPVASIQLLKKRDNGFISKNTQPWEEYKWMDPDTAPWYTNQRNRLGPEWRYFDKEVSYIYNDDGFRNDKNLEDVQDDYYAVFGASPIEAIALPKDETISDYITEESGTYCYNFGMSGTALFEQYNNFMVMMTQYKPPKAILMTSNRPHNSTVEDPDNPGYYVKVGPWIEHFKKYLKNRDNDWLDLVIDYYRNRVETNKFRHEQEMILRMMKMVCDDKGVPLVMLACMESYQFKDEPLIGPKNTPWIGAGMNGDEDPIEIIFHADDEMFMEGMINFKSNNHPVDVMNFGGHSAARDGYHQGWYWNQRVAKRFLEIVNG